MQQELGCNCRSGLCLLLWCAVDKESLRGLHSSKLLDCHAQSNESLFSTQLMFTIPWHPCALIDNPKTDYWTGRFRGWTNQPAPQGHVNAANKTPSQHPKQNKQNTILNMHWPNQTYCGLRINHEHFAFREAPCSGNPLSYHPRTCTDPSLGHLVIWCSSPIDKASYHHMAAGLHTSRIEFACENPKRWVSIMKEVNLQWVWVSNALFSVKCCHSTVPMSWHALDLSCLMSVQLLDLFNLVAWHCNTYP